MSKESRMYCIRFDAALYDKLVRAAFVLDIPPSVLIRWSVRDYSETILEGGNLNGDKTRGETSSQYKPARLLNPGEDPGKARE